MANPTNSKQVGRKSVNRVIFDRLGRVFAFETEDFEYYEALINRTSGSEVPLVRSYLTIPEIEDYYSLSNGTGLLSSAQYEYLSNHGYQFNMPSSNDSVYSRSCLFMHNDQIGSSFNIEVFENCLVDRTELIASVPNETIFESPTLKIPPSFSNNNYTVVEGGNCMLPSNIGTLDQTGYGADIYYKLREDASDQTALIELANYFSQLASSFQYIFYDEETNAFEYIGPSNDDPTIQYNELTLIPQVFKREAVYSISAFNSKFPRNEWFYDRKHDSIISAENIRSTIPGWYNAQSIDYTTYDIPSFKDWSVFDYEELGEVVDYIEDLYNDVVAADPSYANNQNMINTDAWIDEARSNLPLTLSYRLHLRHNIIAILNTLGAFERYEYSILDLVARQNLVQSGGGVFLTAIQSKEQDGMAGPINGYESNTQYMNRFDTESAFYLGFEYMKMYVDNFFEPVALLNVIQKAQAVRNVFKSHKGSYQKNLDDIFKGMNNSLDDWFDLTAFKNTSPKVPGGANKTNIGKTLWDDAYKVKPKNGSSAEGVIDDVIANGDNLGAKTEGLVDDIMVNNGYSIADGKYFGANGVNGFDGVYYKGSLDNPSEIIIIESKQMSSSGSSTLSGPNSNTGLPSQMSDNWINYVANKLKNTSNVELAFKIEELQLTNTGFIKKYVAAIDKAKGELNFLKLDNY
jgi:hypothetical protein